MSFQAIPALGGAIAGVYGGGAPPSVTRALGAVALALNSGTVTAVPGAVTRAVPVVSLNVVTTLLDRVAGAVTRALTTGTVVPTATVVEWSNAVTKIADNAALPVSAQQAARSAGSVLRALLHTSLGATPFPVSIVPGAVTRDVGTGTPAVAAADVSSTSVTTRTPTLAALPVVPGDATRDAGAGTRAAGTGTASTQPQAVAGSAGAVAVSTTDAPISVSAAPTEWSAVLTALTTTPGVTFGFPVVRLRASVLDGVVIGASSFVPRVAGETSQIQRVLSVASMLTATSTAPASHDLRASGSSTLNSTDHG